MTYDLERIASLQRALDDQREQLLAQVAVARQENCTWAEIGAVLGITKQAAHKRFAPRRVDIETLPLSDPLFDPLFTHKD